jgi:hypothetical protein
MKKLTQTPLAVIALILGVASIEVRAQDGATDPNALEPVPAPDTYETRWDAVQVRQELAKTSGIWRDANGISIQTRLVPQQSIVVSGRLGFLSTSHVLGVANPGSLLIRRALDGQGKPVELKPRTSYPLVGPPGAIDYTQLVHASSTYWGYPATATSGESESLGLWRPASPPVTDGDEAEGDAPAPNEEPTAPTGMPGSLNFSLQVDLAADQNVPASLSLLECQASVLCARSYLEADVPFVASDQWYKPVPDLRIRVWKADAGYSEYAFGTESRCDGGLVRCFPQSYPFEPARESVLSVFNVPSRTLWAGWTISLFAGRRTGTPMPTYILLDTQLRQTNGAPCPEWTVQEMRNNYLETGANSEGIVLALLAPYTPASIRHVFAVAPYETRLLITLHDVTVVQEDAAPASGASGRTR